MGDLIHATGQAELFEAKLECRRCKGEGTVYRSRLPSGVSVHGGKRVPCPDCGGRGKIGVRRRRRGRAGG